MKHMELLFYFIRWTLQIVDIIKLEKLKKVNHVEDVIWYDDAMDITVPTEMLPD